MGEEVADDLTVQAESPAPSPDSPLPTPPPAPRTCLEALKGLFWTTNYWEVFAYLKLLRGWELFEHMETYTEGVTLLARCAQPGGGGRCWPQRAFLTGRLHPILGAGLQTQLPGHLPE